jgi:adenylate cyclase
VNQMRDDRRRCQTDAWFGRVVGAVHPFGGEVLNFVGDGVLANFSSHQRAGEPARRRCAPSSPPAPAWPNSMRWGGGRGCRRCPFGAALHLGEMLSGNIGAVDRLDFTAVGPAVNLVSRLEGRVGRSAGRC